MCGFLLNQSLDYKSILKSKNYLNKRGPDAFNSLLFDDL